MDPNTESGRQLAATLKNDRLIRDLKLPTSECFDQAKSNIQRLLTKLLYKDAQKEYEKTDRKVRYWFSLFGGPKTLEQLALRLQLPSLYHVLYRDWSSATHGIDIIEGKISLGEDGSTLITQIRVPKDAQLLTSISLSLVLLVLRSIVKHYMPQQEVDFATWYKHELRGFCLKIKPKENLIRVI
jgi:hypothetical protein